MAPTSASPVLNQIPSPATVYLGSSNTAQRLCPAADQAGDPTSNEAYGCSIGSVDPANDVPVVTSLGTLFGPAAGGTTVTINGGNFAVGAVVSFGSATATTVTVVSATQITATAPAFAGPDGSGPVYVSVANPGGSTSPPRAAAVYTYYSADWSAYLGDAGHSSYNPGATSITRGTISGLQPVWQWNPPTSPNAGSVGEFASPTVYDGVAYVGLADGEFYAISEATQHVLWSQFLGYYAGTSCSGSEGITSTATVAPDPVTGDPTVYVNAPNGYLYAFDAATGDVVWQSVVGIPSTTVNDYYAWGSPTVANGKVYVGIASRCDNPLVPAGVLAFNQDTGTQLAYWDSQPAGKVGGSVWSGIGVLPSGDVVTTTGNSEGNNQIPNAESVVVLDGTTLKLLDAWMVPKSQQIYDSDFGASPTIFTGYPNGVATTMIGACNKNGYYYAFRANDVHAGPVWQTMIGEPDGAASADGGECVAAAVWNGHELIEGGDAVTLGGTQYLGSVQALNPTTGAPIWQTGLPGAVLGSPSEDGGGVIAAPVYLSSSGDTGVYLLSAATGAILDFISTEPGADFAQPVFQGSDLLVGAIDGFPLTAYAVTKPGQATPITVSPGTVQPATTDTLTLTATGGLTSPANVIVSGGGVQVESVTIDSPTQATVKVRVFKAAPTGEVNVTLTEPGSPPVSWSCNSCLMVG